MFNFKHWTVWGYVVAGILAGIFYIAATSLASSNEADDQMMSPIQIINGNCSAVVIKSGGGETLLLTANHCVNKKVGYMDQTVRDGKKIVDEVKYYFDVVQNQPRYDLALLRLRNKEVVFPVARIAEERVVDVGDTVYAVGFPFGIFKNLTIGNFNSEIDASYFTGKDVADWVYTSTPPVTGGNSGGGLFQKDEKGYSLIGITSRGIPQFPHANLFSTLDNIKQFLKPIDLSVNEAETTGGPSKAANQKSSGKAFYHEVF